MMENNNKVHKVKINDSGYLLLHKDIMTRLADNFVVQNIGLFAKDDKFRLRIYSKETFLALPYLDKLYKSNLFIKKTNDIIRLLMYSIQPYYKDYVSRGIKLPHKLLSAYKNGELLELTQYDNYIDIKQSHLHVEL